MLTLFTYKSNIHAYPLRYAGVFYMKWGIVSTLKIVNFYSLKYQSTPPPSQILVVRFYSIIFYSVVVVVFFFLKKIRFFFAY